MKHRKIEKKKPTKKRRLKTLDELVEFVGDKFDPQASGLFKDFILNFADDQVPLTSDLFNEKTIYGGDLSTQARLFFEISGKGRGVYNPERIPFTVMERMMRDPQIAIGFSMMSEPIRALSWFVRCKDQHTKILVTQALKRIWPRFIKESLFAVMYGAAAFEKVFEFDRVRVLDETEGDKVEVVFDEEVVLYKKLKNVYLSSLKILVDDNEEYDGFVQENRLDSKQVVLRKNETAFFTYNLKFGNFYGESLLRNVYKYWYWGELLYQFMLRYYEMSGNPPTIVVAPKGYSTNTAGVKVNNLEVALNLGRALRSNSIGAIPYEPDKVKGNNMWDIKRLTDDRRGPMFIEAIAHINVMKLLGLFVPETVATQEVTQREAFFFTQEGLIADFEEFVNNQIIPPLIDLNIPREQHTPCTLKIDKMSHSRKMVLKEMFVEMIRSLRVLAREGIFAKFSPDILEVAEQLEIPMKPREDIFDDSQFTPNSKTERPGDVESDFDFDKTQFPKGTRGEQKPPE